MRPVKIANTNRKDDARIIRCGLPGTFKEEFHSASFISRGQSNALNQQSVNDLPENMRAI